MKRTVTLIAGAAIVLAGSAFGAGETVPETATQESAAIEARPVGDMIDDYLAAKGWSEGENKKASGVFYVAIGRGTIQAPLADRGYIDSRVNAYNKAMLDAKANMAEYLKVAIKTQTAHAYAEGALADLGQPVPLKPAARPQPVAEVAKREPAGRPMSDEEELEVLAKQLEIFGWFARTSYNNPIMGLLGLVELLQAEEEAEATEQPAAAPAPAPAPAPQPEARPTPAQVQRIEGLLNSEKYRKLISSFATAEIIGMQVCCSFESVPAGGRKGEIGVVAIWSPKLHAMARSISGGGSLPAGIAKKPIREQIPADKMALLSTFGVQQKINENGELVVVAFGQAGAVSDSPMSVKAAEDKARMNAVAAIREFAGESVAVGRDMASAESVEELENAAEVYQNESTFIQRIRAEAETMNISGISTVKRVTMTHPLAGRTVAVVVCAWSPRQAANARNMKAGMGGAVSGGSSAPPAPSGVKVFQGGLQNRGADADDDAF